MLTPNVIETDNPSGALIGYNNLLTASSTAASGIIIPESALTPNTYERYLPASGALSVKYNMAAVADVNYIAIAAHALAGETLLIQTAPTTGSGTLTDVASITPTDNSAIMINFDTRNVQEVVITATLSAASEIGVIHMGMSLQMPRSIYGGHSPSALSQETEFHDSMSESGQILGRTIIRKGIKASYSWQFLDDEWYRDTFQPFVEAARTTPVFIKWRSDYYPNETIYGLTSSDIKPSNMGGGHRMMAVSLNLKGQADL